MKHPLLFTFFISWFIFFGIFLAHFLVVGQAVYGDARFYYSYARSLAIDGNLDIKNELYHVWSPESNNSQVEITPSEAVTYPIQTMGPSLFWAIPIFFTHLVVNTINSFGFSLINSGYSDLYQIVVGIFTTAISALSLVLCLRMSKSASLKSFLILVALVFGTNLIYYLSIDTLNTHFWSLFLSVAFFFIFIRNKNYSGYYFLLSGLIVGLAFVNRNHDILSFLPFVLWSIYQSKGNTNKLRFIFLFTSIFVLSILPQIFVWYLEFGSPLPPMVASSLWSFSLSHFFGIFTNNQTGLIFTSPLILGGIYLLTRSKSSFDRLSLVAIALQLLLISSWFAWTQGESYGIRMLINTYPLIYLGLNSSILKSWSPRNLVQLFSFFVFLNLAMIFRYMAIQSGITPATLHRLKNLF